MGASLNTAILPSIPLSRRVINNKEEHQRKVLDSYVEGMDRGTNTSPAQSWDEQQDETKTNLKGQKPVVTQADLQEETLQLESPETEDTGMKQADPIVVQAQDVAENNIPVVEDTSEQQVQVANTDSQVDEDQQEPDIPIIIKLPLMMMSRMAQYNSAIWLHNQSCQEVSEYPLQR